jgi:hypothetical protein
MALVDNIQHGYQEFGGNLRWLRERYRDEVLTLDLHQMQRRFQGQYAYRRNRFFSYYYSSDMRTLRSLRLNGTNLSFQEARNDLDEIVKIADMANHLHMLEAECSETMGTHFRGEATEWENLKAAIIWTKQYYDRYGPPSSAVFRDLLCSGPGKVDDLKGRVDRVEEAALRLEDALSETSEMFALDGMTNGRPLHQVPFEEITVWSQLHLDSADRFQEWTELARVKREATQRGIGDLLSLAAQGQLPSSGLWEATRRRFLRCGTTTCYRTNEG